jgi:RNA polymerase sigma-70 factor, ECF subfamily
MTDVGEFQSYRPLLFSIAYRMLGSASDAEDVVQDAWLRYADGAPDDLRSLKAWLTTVTARLCLDRLKAARTTREAYVGSWLPEPVLTSDERPDAMLQRHESVTLAFLVLLDTLSPEERAVFLLREIFDYPHDEIAAMLDLSAANSRQLLHRAKQRIADGRPRQSMDPADNEGKRALAERFVRAFTTHDATSLADLLAVDVKFVSDGGGKASAARRPLSGRDAVLNLLLGIQRTAAAHGVLEYARAEIIDVNFEPGILIRVGGHVDSVYALEIAGGAIAGLRVVRNPDKLQFIERQLMAER